MKSIGRSECSFWARLVIAGAGIMLAAVSGAQPVPMLVNYQGRLATPDGAPFPTADYSLTVRLYDAPNGGTLVWGPQLFDGEVGAGHGAKVPVVQGYFNVVLGPVDTSNRSMAMAFTASNRFVEITVSNRAPILPRQQILSTPYAIQAGNGSPPGTISAFGGETIPDGWLLCDGSAYNRSTFPALFNAIATAWGADDASTFRVPDLQGYFLRGVSRGTGRDPDGTTRTYAFPGGNAGTNVGSIQSDSFESHTHSAGSLRAALTHAGGVFYLAEGSPGFRYNGRVTLNTGAGAAGNTSESVDVFGATGSPNATSIDSGFAETRPKNAYVHYIIKF